MEANPRYLVFAVDPGQWTFLAALQQPPSNPTDSNQAPK
jgi:hypothetical protein